MQIKITPFEGFFMTKRRCNDPPERQAQRKIRNAYLQENPIRGRTDVHTMIKKIMAILLKAIFAEV